MAYTEEDREKLLTALEKSLSNVTMACKSTGITRRTYYKWLDKDKDFRNRVKEIKEVADDYVESKLMEKIKGKETASIHFYLKSRHPNYKPQVENYNINFDVDDNKSEEEIDRELERIERALNKKKET